MILRTRSPLRRLRATLQSHPPHQRRPPHAPARTHFSTTTPAKEVPNRIYDAVRTPANLSTLLLLHTSSRTPLLTLWTSSYCRTCRAVLPLMTSLLSPSPSLLCPSSPSSSPSSPASFPPSGPVGFAEIQLDAPDMGDLGAKYMVTSVPTLLAFVRGEARLATRLAHGREMADEGRVRAWVEGEAGARDRGRGLWEGLFGG